MSTPSLPRLRVVYFTTQDSQVANLAIPMLESLGLHVLLVIGTPGPPARPSIGYKDLVANIIPGYDVLITTHVKRLAGMLRSLEPDLILVTGFSWRLPPDLLALPRLGAVNVHPALLPHYRGPDPFFWMFMNGESEMGMTVHRMDAEFDTGPILAQASAPIGPDDTIEDLLPKLFQLAAEVIPQGVIAAINGDPGTPQPPGGSYARLRSPADRPLDWTRPAAQLRNQIRAWYPEGALATLDGRQWIVTRASVETAPSPATLMPGTIISANPDGILVQTGDGLLRLLDLTPTPEEGQTESRQA